MSKDTLFEPGIEYRPVSPGIQWEIQRSDGSGVMGWAPTRAQARQRATAYVREHTGGQADA